MEVAKTILKQLGGGAFIAMTGAKNFMADTPNNALSFKIGGGAKGGINYVKVTLTAADLYDVEFFKVRKFDVKTVSKVEGIYCDQLQAVFTAATGFEVTL